MAIAQTFIQDLLNRADIVDVVGKHVTLRRGGANHLGLCPFHGEKTPSFTVSPTKQFFHCFGCGRNGNAITFLMEHTGATFIEAVHDLAGQYGLSVPEEQSGAQERAHAQARKDRKLLLLEAMERAAVFYQTQLSSHTAALGYLKERGLSEEVIRNFRLGYAPAGWRSLAGCFPDYSQTLLEEAGLVIARDETGTEAHPHNSHDTGDSAGNVRYDRFRDRLMFPILSPRGEVIGFGGRVRDNSLPKYLNSPQTPVFNKGEELYGLFEARQAIRTQGYCLVTEGYMDVVALAQMGFANAVATLGTACTSAHVQKLLRQTDNVVFGFDGDAAGQRAAVKALMVALAFASDTRSIKFLFLPPEHDPDSFIRTHGAAAFEKFVANAKALSVFLVEVAAQGCDLSSAEGRAKMASQAMPLWTPLPDGALKRQLISEIAAGVQISPHELLQLWNARIAPSRSRYGTSATSVASAASGASGTGFSSKAFGNRLKVTSRGRLPFASSAAAAPMRLLPASRADHAMRLLLLDNSAWGQLTAQEHQLLCELPAPHGAVFAWLDHQYMEYGAQNWAALSIALAGEPFAAFAHGQVQKSTELQTTFSAQELRDVLRNEQLRRLDAQLKDTSLAMTQAPHDAQLRERYYALLSERKALMETT